MRKALAVNQAACRVVKNREQQQMRVVGLSTTISQFQQDSTHSLWEKQDSSPKGDLSKIFQRVFHQHWPELGQK